MSNSRYHWSWQYHF